MQFDVLTGPVSSSLSTFEGPGLDVSSSGKPTYYVMTLRDDKGAPKGSHLGSLNVEILEFNKMIQIKPNITAVPNSRGVFNVTYLPTISGAYVIMTRWLGVQVGEARYMTVNPGKNVRKWLCSFELDNDKLDLTLFLPFGDKAENLDNLCHSFLNILILQKLCFLEGKRQPSNNETF